MRADLNLRVIDGRRGNRSPGLVDGLIEIGTLTVGEHFLVPYGNDSGLRHLDASIPPDPFVRTEKQIELLLQWNCEWIDLDGSRVLSCTGYRRTQIHALARHSCACLRDFDCEARDAFYFSHTNRCARGKSPRIINKHTHPESLCILIADGVHVAVFDTGRLMPAINDSYVRVPSAFQCRNVQCPRCKVPHDF